MNLLLALAPLALAGPERLTPPGASVAGENGASSAWVNPATMGYAPGGAYGFWYRQDLIDGSGALAVSTSGGGTGLGVYVHSDAAGDTWWGLNSALSIELPGEVRIGSNVTWNLPTGEDNNFVSWDLGGAWRPLPWLGFGGVARNIGDPAPDLGVTSNYTVGAWVRPLDERLEIGVDYDALLPLPEGSSGLDGQTIAGVLRSHPIDGLEIRARGTHRGEFEAGLTVYFGDTGVGAFGEAGLEADSPLAVTAALGSSPQDERLFGGGKRVPVITLDSSYPYQPTASLFAAAAPSYLSLIRRLERAEADRSVKAVILKLEGFSLSFAQLQEVSEAIDRVQRAGKPVIAYLKGSPGNGAYMLAAGCDKVLLHPAGDLDLVGLSMEVQFFRGALDLVGVEPQFARRAEYKSAVESYTETEPSAPSREQMDALADDLFASLVSGIAAGRGMSEDDVRALIDAGPFTGREALERGLVDALTYPDEVEAASQGLLPEDMMPDEDYAPPFDNTGWAPSKQIALVYVDGPITSGESAGPGLFGGGGNAGSETVTRALRQAASIDSIKAVVLRVDSPGGSAFASDEIWRAVEQVKAAGKPVVVSMGGVAASGGYYVAAGADAIFAEPATITGSIGVYGGKMSFGELYEKVGLSYELFTRGRNAAMYSSSRPMDPIEYAALERLIDDTYDQFKERVAEGRGMTKDEVDVVARGRVWSGQRAIEVGLVDQLGGLQEAIDYARDLAGLTERSDFGLVTLRGRETSWGDPIVDQARVRLQATLQPRVVLPEPLQQWSGYAPLADEPVLMLMPWQVDAD